MKYLFLIFLLINVDFSFADKKCLDLVRQLADNADSPSKAGVLSQLGFSSKKEYNRDDQRPLGQSIRNNLLPVIEHRVKRLGVPSMNEQVITFLDYLLGRKLSALSLEELNKLKLRKSPYEKEELFLEFMEFTKTLTIREINRLYFDYARDHGFHLIDTIPPTLLTVLGILAVYPDFDFIIAFGVGVFPVFWGLKGGQEEIFKEKNSFKGVKVLEHSFIAMLSSALVFGVAPKTGVDLASMGVSDPVLTGSIVGLAGFTLGALSNYISFYFSKNKKRLRELMMYLQHGQSLSDPVIQK